MFISMVAELKTLNESSNLLLARLFSSILKFLLYNKSSIPL